LSSTQKDLSLLCHNIFNVAIKPEIHLEQLTSEQFFHITVGHLCTVHSEVYLGILADFLKNCMTMEKINVL
jgi:hypothetical protein